MDSLLATYEVQCTAAGQEDPIKAVPCSDLLSCPFCGGLAKLNSTRFGRPVMKWVVCTRCESACGAYSEASSAIKAWNNRTPGQLNSVLSNADGRKETPGA